MLVNVTADHRIIYGADLAAFLQTFSKIVENPESLTMFKEDYSLKQGSPSAARAEFAGCPN
ncbi:unnamed protein product [Thlaspi arvense]|uniref:2-oxoacid dehydrogenase acyltransferase catalytic domain-containing protein n=1 Tax=Thlaspi arvense TaxID=13288 RepID=A0AAU9RHG7_THLAR|nr:unnamed protein product [Thlaspi arvense]